MALIQLTEDILKKQQNVLIQQQSFVTALLHLTRLIMIC